MDIDTAELLKKLKNNTDKHRNSFKSVLDKYISMTEDNTAELNCDSDDDVDPDCDEEFIFRSKKVREEDTDDEDDDDDDDDDDDTEEDDEIEEDDEYIIKSDLLTSYFNGIKSNLTSTPRAEEVSNSQKIGKTTSAVNPIVPFSVDVSPFIRRTRTNDKENALKDINNLNKIERPALAGSANICNYVRKKNLLDNLQKEQIFTSTQIPMVIPDTQPTNSQQLTQPNSLSQEASYAQKDYQSPIVIIKPLNSSILLDKNDMTTNLVDQKKNIHPMNRLLQEVGKRKESCIQEMSIQIESSQDQQGDNSYECLMITRSTNEDFYSKFVASKKADDDDQNKMKKNMLTPSKINSSRNDPQDEIIANQKNSNQETSAKLLQPVETKITNDNFESEATSKFSPFDMCAERFLEEAASLVTNNFKHEKFKGDKNRETVLAQIMNKSTEDMMEISAEKNEHNLSAKKTHPKCMYCSQSALNNLNDHLEVCIKNPVKTNVSNKTIENTIQIKSTQKTTTESRQADLRDETSNSCIDTSNNQSIILDEAIKLKCKYESCNYRCQTNEKLNCHMKNVHGKIYGVVENIQIEKPQFIISVKKLDVKIFKCKFCQLSSFFDQCEFEKHVQVCTNNPAISQKISNEIISKQQVETFKPQNTSNDETKRIRVDKSKLDPKSNQKIDANNNDNHKEKSAIKCTYEDCSFETNQKNAMKFHMKTHNPKEDPKDNFHCEFCSMSFLTKNTFENHLKKCIKRKQTRSEDETRSTNAAIERTKSTSDTDEVKTMKKPGDFRQLRSNTNKDLIETNKNPIPDESTAKKRASIFKPKRKIIESDDDDDEPKKADSNQKEKRIDTSKRSNSPAKSITNSDQVKLNKKSNDSAFKNNKSINVIQKVQDVESDKQLKKSQANADLTTTESSSKKGVSNLKSKRKIIESDDDDDGPKKAEINQKEKQINNSKNPKSPTKADKKLLMDGPFLVPQIPDANVINEQEKAKRQPLILKINSKAKPARSFINTTNVNSELMNSFFFTSSRINNTTSSLMRSSNNSTLNSTKNTTTLSSTINTTESKRQPPLLKIDSSKSKSSAKRVDLLKKFMVNASKT